MIHRRSFITGLISLVAAPAIVRAGSLMPVKVMEPSMLRYRAIGVDEAMQMLGLLDWAREEMIQITGVPSLWLVQR